MTLTLNIQLEQDEQPFRPPQSISGTVVVQSEAQLECEMLAVALQHASQVRADDDTIVLEQDYQNTLLVDPGNPQAWLSGQQPQQLFQGAWAPGQSQSYPFQLETPSPPGYLGTHFELTWLVHVHAMIRNSEGEQIHCTALQRVEIVRDTASPLPRDTPAALDQQALISAAAGPEIGLASQLISLTTYLGILILLGILPLVSGAGIVAFTLLKAAGAIDFEVLGGNNDAISLVFSGVAAFVFGCYMLPFLWRARHVDDMQLYVAPSPVRPGEKLQFVAMLHKTFLAEVDFLQIRMQGMEFAAGPGTDELQHSILDDQLELPASIGVRQGPWLMYCGEFDLPEDLPSSIQADFGQLEYRLECNAHNRDDDEPLVELEETINVV
jgi:hypothetical protein